MCRGRVSTVVHTCWYDNSTRCADYITESVRIWISIGVDHGVTMATCGVTRVVIVILFHLYIRCVRHDGTDTCCYTLVDVCAVTYIYDDVCMPADIVAASCDRRQYPDPHRFHPAGRAYHSTTATNATILSLQSASGTVSWSRFGGLAEPSRTLLCGIHLSHSLTILHISRDDIMNMVMDGWHAHIWCAHIYVDRYISIVYLPICVYHFYSLVPHSYGNMVHYIHLCHSLACL